MRRTVLMAFCLIPAVTQAADCPKLKATDTYRELSAILECQERRIKTLEGSGGAASPVAATVRDNGVLEPGKCLPYERSEAFKQVVVIKEPDVADTPVTLCWKDGTAMAKVSNFSADGIQIADMTNNVAIFKEDGALRCYSNNYGKECMLETLDAKLTFRPEMIVSTGKRMLVRMHIESNPK